MNKGGVVKIKSTTIYQVIKNITNFVFQYKGVRFYPFRQ